MNPSMRLRDALRADNTRSREIEDVIAVAMTNVVGRHRLSASEAIQGLVGNIVACVQARAMPGEWRDVGDEICTDLMRRLTVRN